MSPDHSPAAARVVGRYEIVRQLGRGGMATVHLARQPDLERVVALKELDRFGTADEQVFASRFLREARLAGSLSHPNIVTVYEYFEHDARPFIAMEYVEGGSLRDHLGALSLAQVVGVLEGLLASLTHAERHVIVHRDIKPENILVTEDGRVKITDFGIAKAYNAVVGASLLTATGTTVGTPVYMAPEQATGAPISNATDLYSVGVLAYEMLVGQVPFDSDEGQLAIVWQHVHEPVPDPRTLRPELDPRLCGWLGQLLEKDPSARPASAAVALEALEEIVLDLLGGRWRRQAPLVASRVEPERLRPLTPARVDAAVQPSGDAQATPPLAEALSAPTIPPLAQRDGTELFQRADRERRADPPPPAPTASWSVTAIAIVVALAIAAVVGGYALFAGRADDPRPRPPASGRAPVATAAAQRFADGLEQVLRRLDTIRVSARQQLATARTARRQAVHARTIGSAYRSAAAGVAQLSPTADQRTAADLVGDKLTRAGQAYEALADAAESHDAAAYAMRRHTISTRESAVRRAVALVPALGLVPTR
jgi:tRNA A-37 threonylcarbamoyl transferase component Bud32